jgi:hypothetical protein
MPFVQLPTPKARRTLRSGCIEKVPADGGLFTVIQDLFEG